MCKLGSFQKCVICDQNISKPVPDCCDQHPACISCIRQYLNHGTHTNIAAIACVSHGCPSTFGDTQKLVQSVFDTKTQANEWWKMALTKTFIVNKVTCPFKSCKAIFDADLEMIKQCVFTECYECHRGFCIACMNEWHPGEMRIVNDTNAALKTLETAKKNQWIRCPRCRLFAQKITGCHAVQCICGCNFCYRCGSRAVNHICTRNCNRVSNAQLNQEKEKMYSL